MTAEKIEVIGGVGVNGNVFGEGVVDKIVKLMKNKLELSKVVFYKSIEDWVDDL